MARLKAEGVEVGFIAMAHGWPALEQKFRARAAELGIADRIRQIPFLPHWRVPEFLRSCLAVCCLEQDFPIVFHTPVIAREVLTCGRCLVASTEVIRKLPDHVRLPDGYGCVAIPDVQGIGALAARLAAMVRALSRLQRLRREGTRRSRRPIEAPVLAEQGEAYLTEQLKLYASEERRTTCMAGCDPSRRCSPKMK
jgi:hypothetical protein